MIGSVELYEWTYLMQWVGMSLTIPRADRSHNAPGFIMDGHNFIIVIEHLVRKCTRPCKTSV